MNYLKGILIGVYVVLIAMLMCMSKCSGADAREEAIGRARTIGQDGNLKITLLWDFPGDIDLHVLQPNGREIYYDKPQDIISKGYLDVDNQRGGHGSAENIYWQVPPSGHYKVGLVFYKKSLSARNGGPCTVVVKRKINGEEKIDTYTINMTVENRLNVISVTDVDI